MNLHQLRFVREAVRQNYNLTEAAKALFTSQPGVSKAIIELEEELGVDIFTRHGKRIRGLTEPGRAVLKSIIEPQVRTFYRSIHQICGHRIEFDDAAVVIGVEVGDQQIVDPGNARRVRRSQDSVRVPRLLRITRDRRERAVAREAGVDE